MNQLKEHLMRTRTRVAAVIATGAVAIALLASPGLAAGQRGDPPTGQSTSQLQTGRGPDRGAGTNANLSDVPSGTLTDAQRSALASIAQDEKLAHDLYVAFAGVYSVPVFDRIAASETKHLAAVRVVLDRYGITDPTAGLAAGVFASAEFQELYDTQLAAGLSGLAAAYEVGVFVETTDIADLQAAMTDLAAPDVEQVYANLLAGSERHLTAFGG